MHIIFAMLKNILIYNFYSFCSYYNLSFCNDDGDGSGCSSNYNNGDGGGDGYDCGYTNGSGNGDGCDDGNCYGNNDGDGETNIKIFLFERK